MYKFNDVDRFELVISPLWAAALEGVLSAVKCLVKNGTDVNSMSESGATPVLAACMSRRLDVVKYLVENKADIHKPNHNGVTCLMNSVQSFSLCEYLLQHGADVNAQDHKGKTALHHAMQPYREVDFKVIKLLLDHGADPLIKNQQGDDALQIACLEFSVGIFNFLLENYDYPPTRVVEAYELMGASAVIGCGELERSIAYWRKAFTLKAKMKEVPPLRSYNSSAQCELFNTTEFNSLEELESMANNFFTMWIQSFLAIKRILGPHHECISNFLVQRCVIYEDNSEFQKLITMWKYLLELQIEKSGLLDHSVTGSARQLFWTFSQLYDLQLCDLQVYGSQLYENNHLGFVHEELQFCDVIGTIRLLVRELPASMELLTFQPVFNEHEQMFNDIIEIIVHLLWYLSVSAKTPEQVREMKHLIRELVNIDPCTTNGDSLLHLAVTKPNKFWLPFSTYADHSVVQLLLECGAQVDAANCDLSTPLHIAAQEINYNSSVVNVLLENGAHIDRRDRSGLLPYIMLRSIPESSVNPIHYTSLQCLVARKIVEQGIIYSGKVPVVVEKFISVH